jgi:hypothetical protein
MDTDLMSTFTLTRPDIEPIDEQDFDPTTPCSTWTIYKGLSRLLHPLSPRQCRQEAVWFCHTPCCGEAWYTCNKHLGNGFPWRCYDCDKGYKATDLPWRKIRR